MVGAPIHRYTYQQYRAHERVSNVKHEFLNGEIYAMAGGTPEHAALAIAVAGVLHGQLRGGPCRIFSSDLCVRAVDADMAAYPDLTIVCGEVLRDPLDKDVVIDPT